MHKLLENNPENWAVPSQHEARPDDIRMAIQLLKKKPDGVAVGADSTGMFGEAKADVYESLGIVTRSGDVLKLSALGWDMARQLEPTTESFRAIISGTEHYRAALNWAFRQCLPALAPKDVMEYWLRECPENVAAHDEATRNGAAQCFFDLCQAAALGNRCADHGSEPPSLRFDREELASYLTSNTFPRLVATSREGISMAQQGPHPRPPKPISEERPPSSAGKTLNEQTIALKILSLALVEELNNIGEEPDTDGICGIDFAGAVRRFETALIKSALACAGGRQRRAARLLNMTKSTFNAKLKRYNIQS